VTDLQNFATVVALFAKYAPNGRTPNQIGEDAAAFKGVAERIAKHAENECNRPVSAAEEKRAERNEAKLREILAPYDGLAVKVTGDPRGYIVRLVCRDQECNTWGGAEDGWGVA
jgi:hypothetical protein